MALSKEKREKIVAQALQEIPFARLYKQGKVKNWQKTEDLHYARKGQPVESRANVDLGLMQMFVHTWLSKLDAPLVFKFKKTKNSQLKRVARLNALRQVDQEKGDWDIKDLAGKKQAAIYGRAVFSYYADSVDNYYCAHNDNVDVYDFLIDPTAGGLNIDKARYLGDYGVILDKQDLKDGVKAGHFLRGPVALLTGDDAAGNAGEMTQEETNKQRRSLDTSVTSGPKEAAVSTDKYVFWRWGTTFEGERYYLLLSERGGTAIRVEKLTDMISPTSEVPRGMWWYWSWAPYPDLTEFWTPSPADYAREIFMAQNVSINQMLDNAEEINKPQKVVNVNMIESLADLKYRRDGTIKVKGDFDVQKAVQFIRPQSINTPIDVYNTLDEIISRTTGVNAGTEGSEKVDGRVAIYKGNQEASADRFGLINRMYAFGYKRLAKLYELGVRDNLTKKVAVEMIGPSGVETEMVSKRDIFHKDDDFGVITEASNAEEQASENEQEAKMQFLQLTSAPASPFLPIQNLKKSYEISAKVAGFDPDTIKELLDTSEFGDAEIISEADKDIEDLLDGKQIKTNKSANLAYKQRFVDFMVDHEDDIDMEQFQTLTAYITSLEPIIMKNFVREMQTKLQKMQMDQAMQDGALPPTGAPPASPQNPPQASGAPASDLSIMPVPAPYAVQLPAQAA